MTMRIPTKARLGVGGCIIIDAKGAHEEAIKARVKEHFNITYTLKLTEKPSEEF